MPGGGPGGGPGGTIPGGIPEGGPVSNCSSSGLHGKETNERKMQWKRGEKQGGGERQIERRKKLTQVKKIRQRNSDSKYY